MILILPLYMGVSTSMPGLMLLTMARKALPSRQLRPKSLTAIPNDLVTCNFEIKDISNVHE